MSVPTLWLGMILFVFVSAGLILKVELQIIQVKTVRCCEDQFLILLKWVCSLALELEIRWQFSGHRFLVLPYCYYQSIFFKNFYVGKIFQKCNLGFFV